MGFLLYGRIEERKEQSETITLAELRNVLGDVTFRLTVVSLV